MKTQFANNRKLRERGSALVEFTIAGIASAVLMITTVQISLAMWNYHTLAYAAHEANRYIVVHGRGCMLGGNSCTITVADIVSKFKANGIGLAPTNVNLTLTSHSGTTHTCNPISTCSIDTTQWPPTSGFDNAKGKYSTINAKYAMNMGIVGIWFGTSGTQIGTIALTSQSKLQMLF